MGIMRIVGFAIGRPDSGDTDDCDIDWMKQIGYRIAAMSTIHIASRSISKTGVSSSHPNNWQDNESEAMDG